jgi:hypothetical protein
MKWNLNRDGQQFHQYQQNVQSPLTLTHWRQKEEDIWRWKCMFFFFWPLICLSFDWRFLTTFWPLICLSFFDGFWLPFDHWSVCLSLTDSDYLLTIDLSVFLWRILTTFWPLICLSFFDGFWLPFDHWSVCLSLTDSEYLLTIDLFVFLWRILTTFWPLICLSFFDGFWRLQTCLTVIALFFLSLLSLHNKLYTYCFLEPLHWEMVIYHWT